MDANYRDGRWHAVKLFPKPFAWMRRRYGALRWTGEAWERDGQFFTKDAAEEHARYLNFVADIETHEAAHAQRPPLHSADFAELELRVLASIQHAMVSPPYVFDYKTGQYWRANDDVYTKRSAEAHGFDLQQWFAKSNLRTAAAKLDRSHLGCG